MPLKVGIRRVSVRFDPTMGADGTFLMRCDACVTSGQTSAYWPLTREFWDTTIGLQRCRACQRAKRRSTVIHSREFLRARERRYYRSSRDKVLAYRKVHYAANRERICEQRRANYAARKARESSVRVSDDRAGAEGGGLAA